MGPNLKPTPSLASAKKLTVQPSHPHIHLNQNPLSAICAIHKICGYHLRKSATSAETFFPRAMQLHHERIGQAFKFDLLGGL